MCLAGSLALWPQGGRSFTNIHRDVETMSQCGAGEGRPEQQRRWRMFRDWRVGCDPKARNGACLSHFLCRHKHTSTKRAHAEGEFVSSCQKGMPDRRVLIWARPGIRSACSLGLVDLSHTRPSALMGLDCQNPSHLFPQGCLHVLFQEPGFSKCTLCECESV